MKHLSSEELSARLDGALTGRAAEQAERHLAACEECRAALAALAAQDASLKPALTHDPGEAYFESFAGRVGDRIRAAGLAGAQARERGFGFGRLSNSPRALAWAGGVAVLVVGAGLALMTGREARPPDLRDRELTERSQPATPGTKETPQYSPETRMPEPVTTDRVDRDEAAQKARTGAEQFGQEEIRGSATRRQDEALAQRERGGAAPSPAVARAKVDRLTRPAQAPQPLGSPAPAAELQRNENSVTSPRASQNRAAAPPAAMGSPGATAEGLDKKLADAPRKDTRAMGSLKSQFDGGAKAESSARLNAFAKPPESGAAAPAPADARYLYESKQASGSVGEARLCGEVRDAGGRPVAGAQVTVADVGRTTSSDARGAFCLDAPAGEHPISVMAVGFAESRQTVNVGAAAPMRVTLQAVSVMEDKRGAISGRTPLPRVIASPPAEPADRYSALPDTVRSMVRAAQQLEMGATSGRSARLFDAAAGSWERALRRLEGGPLELDTRLRLAEARYHAWEAGPNTRRADAAVEALTAYALRARAGPDRDRVVRWLDRVKH